MENPSKWHWGHFSNEIFCFKTGLSGLQEFQVASREIRLKPEGAAKSGHVSESSKVADGSLRFKVVVVSKSGFRASKMMDINVTTGEASILDKGATVLMIRIYQISQAEKSAKDPSRIMLIFFGDLNEPVDLIFQDRFTRDCFCELLTSLNPSIVFKFSQQQRNPNWISDKSVSLCMRCRKQFTMTLRKHHCRSCGFVM